MTHLINGLVRGTKCLPLTRCHAFLTLRHAFPLPFPGVHPDVDDTSNGKSIIPGDGSQVTVQVQTLSFLGLVL